MMSAVKEIPKPSDQEDQKLTVQQDWTELSSEKSTGGNTASTDPGLCTDLRQRSNAAKPVSFGDGNGGPASRAGSNEATNDRVRDDYTFAGCSERFVTFYNEQPITGNA